MIKTISNLNSLSRLADWCKARPKCEDGGGWERKEGSRHGEGMTEMKWEKTLENYFFFFFHMKYFKNIFIEKKSARKVIIWNIKSLKMYI